MKSRQKPRSDFERKSAKQDPRALLLARQVRVLRGEIDSVDQGPDAEARTAQAVPSTADRPEIPQLPPIPPDPSRADFEAAERRVTEMEAVAAFARRHGVGFDLQTAIRSRLTARAARDQVLKARADADEALVTFSHFPHASQAAANRSQGWDRAITRAAQHHGHKVPGAGR